MGGVARWRRTGCSAEELPGQAAERGPAGHGYRAEGRVLPGGGQPAVGTVAPNDEVTGAIPQNGERRAGAKPGVIMCIIGDLLS